jgi:cytoskeletal protein CcmA (bactofilin family)
MSSQVDEFFARHRHRTIGDAAETATIAPAAVISGDVSGDLEVEPGAVIRVDGDVDGEICVRTGGIVEVHGDVSGSVEVETAGQLRIEGGVGGDVLVHVGAIASVAGDISGDATVEGALMVQNGDVGGRLVVRSGAEFIND